MRRCVAVVWAIPVLAGLLGGCTSNGPQEQTIDVRLLENATFEADAGQVFVKVLRADFEDSNGGAGGGRLAILPEDVVLTESDTNGATLEDCMAACTSNGLDAANCAAVCEQGKVLVRIRIGTGDDADVACAQGDAYGPYLVTVDDAGVGTDVSPVSEVLGNETIASVNGDILTICIGVVAPVEGSVELTKLTLTVTP